MQRVEVIIKIMNKQNLNVFNSFLHVIPFYLTYEEIEQLLSDKCVSRKTLMNNLLIKNV